MAAFREVFLANGELDRDTTIREVARALGFNRTGSRINFRIRYMFPIATRRGIIRKTETGFAIECRSISDYRRDDLIDALLDAMGRAWIDREDAIKHAARHLGFRRTGHQIRDAFKSALNGAIRRRLLEYDGSEIRRAS
jgi:AraC-like DNA-binding protein